MQYLDASNAEAYLRRSDRVCDADGLRIERLDGGVSNEVLYVSIEGRPEADFVVKQARERLRTPDEWVSRLDRIWREVDTLAACRDLLDRTSKDLPSASRPSLRADVPRVLFTDRANYLFAMTAVPRPHEVWKRELLEGTVRPHIAAACGNLLGRLHAGSWHDTALAAGLDDREVFSQLRLDPYYCTVAAAHADVREPLSRLVDEVWQHRHALVHGDFSPKNLLLDGDRLVLVDFETGHYGDPAFDIGFFLSHLVLKMFYHAPRHADFLDLLRQFWQAYLVAIADRVPPEDRDALAIRAASNLAGCLLARLDGKSKIDYLTSRHKRDAVRALARELLRVRPRDWHQTVEMIENHVQTASR